MIDPGDGSFDPERVMTLEEFMKYLEDIDTDIATDSSRWDAHEREQMLMMRAASDAGAEAGTGADVEPVDEIAVFKTIHLKTDLFEGVALPLHQMPGLKVLEIMLLPHEPVKMIKMVELLTSALSGEKAVELLGVLSMHELNEVLSQWVDKSQEAEEE